MLKKFYKIIIIPYTLVLLYLMFLGTGRTQYDENIVRITPVYATLSFINNTISGADILKLILGNIILFIPYGFIRWVFPKIKDCKSTMICFISAIVIVEALQYFTRLGVFDVDDIILNSFGVFTGCLICNFLKLKFPYLIHKKMT